MLTQVRLEIVPGDKRLLKLTLPKDARFWFAFVNQNGVWPWREQDQHPDPARAAVARRQSHPRWRSFYSSRIGSARPSLLDLESCGAEVRSAAREHHLARLTQRQMATEGLDRLAPVAAGGSRARNAE